MLILFAAESTGRKPHTLKVEDRDRDLVLAFLDGLEQNNAVSTRNARLTAIRSFFHHVAANDPASLGIAQRILAIPTKKTHMAVTNYLTRHEVDALVDAPDQQTLRGPRDRALLLFLARTGARVSEAISVNASPGLQGRSPEDPAWRARPSAFQACRRGSDLQLDRPRPQVLLRGKGRRERIVPISDDLAKVLKALINERQIAPNEVRPLFVGTHDMRLTRFGATHIVRRAVATTHRPELANKSISPHVFRHSLAMMLLQSGVDLLTIQAWLGHAQVATTHRYAAADVEMMRRGLDMAGVVGSQAARYRPKDAVLELLETI